MKELWGDLSEAEQKAAKDLGFDAEIWEEGRHAVALLAAVLRA